MREAKYYWCVKVKEEICKKKEIYLHADSIEVREGNLIFIVKDFICFCIAKGNWDVFYAASVLDGHAVYVEHWDGEHWDGEVIE